MPEYETLREYDLLIMGEIIPAKNEMDHLFLKTEITIIKSYVKNGGNLLISTSSGGDFDYEREDDDIEDYGSIRALSPITGVKRYWWGEVFHPSKKKHLTNPEDLLFSRFPDHPIFEGINQILLADTTFLEPSTVFTPKILFTTLPGTMFRYFVDDTEECVDDVPLITYRKLGTGSSLVIGSTLFMSPHQKYGTPRFNNAKFFLNIINWLSNQ
ncbi:MAG: hypothetical protein EU530_05535 [Promethearchaeota archaeon]|nr:MAG: hypothetical protein EU530_05535 [Candidatus Lokiarchaeota archaeon]